MKVAFYDAAGLFLSLVSTSGGLAEYVVPTGAHYAIFQNAYANGDVAPLYVRYVEKPTIKRFADLILSPLYARPDIVITGDSNTYGYGLSDTALSWANLMASELQQITSLRYGGNSRYVEILGAHDNSTEFNCKTGAQISIWTDAMTVTLGYGTNYSSVFDWYIDGVLASEYTSKETIELDGGNHKVTVKFTGGQMVHPFFSVPKTITITNTAVSGVSTTNVPVTSGKDWLVVMIGTNNRTFEISSLSEDFAKYTGKATYITPIPNHKSADEYVYNQLLTHAKIMSLFEQFGYEIINCADVFGYAFYDNTLFQGDMIHINENGHRVLANIVSGKMGLPCCFGQSD